MTRHRLSLALLLLFGAPQLTAQRTLWIGRLGSDTALIESAVRTDSTIRGTIVNVAAGLLVQHYEADLADGRIRSLRAWVGSQRTGPVALDGPPSTEVLIGDDSIRVIRRAGDSMRVTAVPAIEGAVPLFDAFFDNPLALLEAALQEADRRGETSIAVYYIGNPAPEVLPLTRGTAGQVTFPYVLARVYPMLAGATLHAELRDGLLRAFDASETTFKIHSERQPWQDATTFIDQFRRQEITRGGMGWMSPPTSASGRIDDVQVTVQYGQPSRRGRRIFPDVVPDDAVWRAGANAATQVTFSGDVLVAGKPLSAGSYSLWILPTREADTLILNSATRIWGVSYDAMHDVLRVPMQRQMLPERVEALTYNVADAGLSLSWDDRRLRVAIRSATAAP